MNIIKHYNYDINDYGREYLHVVGLHAGLEMPGWKKHDIFSFSWDFDG